MIVLNPVIGAAIGAMIKAAGMAARVELEDDAVRVVFLLSHQAQAEEPKTTVQKKTRGINKRKCVTRFSTSDVITSNGEALSIKDWAYKLGVSPDCIKYRLGKHGSPYGNTKPTDKDKVVAGLGPGSVSDLTAEG